MTTHDAILEKIVDGLDSLGKEQFVYVGTLELITGVITFLGVLFALNNRLVGEYQALLDSITKRQARMLDSMQKRASEGKLRVEDAELYAYYEGKREAIWNMKRDMSANYQVILILGICVLVGYGLALLSEQLPYSIFATISVIAVAMAPSVIYTLRHKRNLQRLARLDTGT